MKAHELLSDESKWTQKTNARDANGYFADPLSGDAVCFCLNGAIIRAYGNTRATAVNQFGRVRDELKCEFPQTWNDAPERTFQEVRDLLVKLDI